MEINVAVVPDYCYKGRRELTGDVVFTDAVTCIGISAFMYTRITGAVDLPPSVTTVADYAFWMCHYITSVRLPPGITCGFDAFGGCESLAEVCIDTTSGKPFVCSFRMLPRLQRVTMPVEFAISAYGSRTFASCGSEAHPAHLNLTGVSDCRETLLRASERLAMQFKSRITFHGKFADGGFVFDLLGDDFGKHITSVSRVILADLSGDTYPVDWDGAESFRATASRDHQALQNGSWSILWGDELVEDITAAMVRDGVRDAMIIWLSCDEVSDGS